MKKKAVLLALAAAMLISGCSGQENSEGSVTESSGLPIDASNNNMGGVEIPSKYVEPSIDPEIAPDIELNIPTGAAVAKTPSKTGGTHMVGGKKYNLVPETGVKMPSATDLGSVYINGMFYNILNVKVSEIISQSTGAIAGETWTCPQENEVIPDDFGFSFSGKSWEMPIVHVETNEDGTEETSLMQDGVFLEVLKDKELVTEWVEPEPVNKDEIDRLKEELGDEFDELIYPYEYDWTDLDDEGYVVKAIGDKITNEREAEDHLPVIFAGGVEVGQTKEQAVSIIGDGYEIKVVTEEVEDDETSLSDNAEPRVYIYSFYKTDEVTLMIKYAYDEYEDEQGEVQHTFTEDGGWYVNSVIVFKNVI